MFGDKDRMWLLKEEINKRLGSKNEETNFRTYNPLDIGKCLFR